MFNQVCSAEKNVMVIIFAMITYLRLLGISICVTKYFLKQYKISRFQFVTQGSLKWYKFFYNFFLVITITDANPAAVVANLIKEREFL